MSKFSERFKLLRMSRSLSQQDLASQIGLSKSSVNMYERGEREPSFVTLEKIADYFNVDMDYLLGNSDYTSKHEWLKNYSDLYNQFAVGGSMVFDASQIKEAPLPEGLSDVKQLLIEEILSADDADIADLISYLKVKKGITLSDP